MRGTRATTAAVVLGLLLTTVAVIDTTDAGFSSITATVNNAATAASLQPPGTPTATYQCALAQRSVVINWSASPTGIVTHYRVYESQWNSSTASWGAATLVATVAYGTNTWTDTSVAGAAQYRYRLNAIRTGTSWVSADTAWSNSVNSPALCV